MRTRKGSLRSKLLLATCVLLLPLVVVELLLRPFLHTGSATFVGEDGKVVVPIDTKGPFPQPRPGFRGKLVAGEFSVIVAIGPDGRREPWQQPAAAAAAVEPTPEQPGLELVVVGDSFTFGWGVEFEDTFGALLLQHLRRHFDGVPIRLVNLGCPGTGLHSQRLWLQQYLAQPRPGWRPVVVWTVLIENGLASGNDLIDNYNSLRPAPPGPNDHLTPEARRDSSLSPGSLIRIKTFLGRYSVSYELVMRALGSSLRRFAPTTAGPGADAVLAAAWVDFASELRVAVQPAEPAAGRRGVPMVFGYMPYFRELANDDASVCDRLRAALPADVPLVSLLPGLRPCMDRCSYPRDGHPTPVGHAAIAAAYAPSVVAAAERALAR